MKNKPELHKTKRVNIKRQRGWHLRYEGNIRTGVTKRKTQEQG